MEDNLRSVLLREAARLFAAKASMQRPFKTSWKQARSQRSVLLPLRVQRRITSRDPSTVHHL
jgi:hypothetical protein